MLARTILKLRKGINFFNRLILSENDSCAQEEIQEVIVNRIKHCSIESTAEYQPFLETKGRVLFSRWNSTVAKRRT